jgi:hypothetical protein
MLPFWAASRGADGLFFGLGRRHSTLPEIAKSLPLPQQGGGGYVDTSRFSFKRRHRRCANSVPCPFGRAH